MKLEGELFWIDEPKPENDEWVCLCNWGDCHGVAVAKTPEVAYKNALNTIKPFLHNDLLTINEELNKLGEQ